MFTIIDFFILITLFYFFNYICNDYNSSGMTKKKFYQELVRSCPKVILGIVLLFTTPVFI